MDTDDTERPTAAGIFGRLQAEIDSQEQEEGISPAQLLELSDELRRIVQLVAREGEMLAGEVAERLDVTIDEATELLSALEEKGYLTSRDTEPGRRYKARFARRRSHDLPGSIWSALSDKMDTGE